MIAENMQKCVSMFNEGKTNVHEEQHSGSSSYIAEEMMCCIDENFCSNRRFLISHLPINYQNISRSLLHEILI